MKNRSVQYGPRFGFAYALTRDDNLVISANYAWSKSLGYYPPFATYHYNKLQYGVLPFDRTYVLRFYYVYNLPKVSTK